MGFQLNDIQSLGDRTYRVTWSCDWGGLDHYEYVWWVLKAGESTWTPLGDPQNPSTWSLGLNTSMDYTVDSNLGALDKVSIWLKACSTGSWGMGWVTKERQVSADAPGVPPTPEWSITGNKIKINFYDIPGSNNGGSIVLANDCHCDEIGIKIRNLTANTWSNEIFLSIESGSASYEGTVTTGAAYQVYWCGYNNSRSKSTYQGYSNANMTNNVVTHYSYAAPTNINYTFTSITTNSRYMNLSWNAPTMHTNALYKIKFIDAESGNWGITSTVNSFTGYQNTSANGLSITPGRYQMRICAYENGNEENEGEYLEFIANIGYPPNRPNAWSDKKEYIGTEDVILYWQHNASDSTRMYGASIEVIYGDRGKATYSVDYTNRAEVDWYKNGSFVLPSNFTYINSNNASVVSSFEKSEKVTWRVATKGADGTLGEWSIEQEFMHYKVPNILTWSQNGGSLASPSYFDRNSSISGFPFTLVNVINEEHYAFTERETFSFYNTARISSSYMFVTTGSGNRSFATWPYANKNYTTDVTDILSFSFASIPAYVTSYAVYQSDDFFYNYSVLTATNGKYTPNKRFIVIVCSTNVDKTKEEISSDLKFTVQRRPKTAQKLKELTVKIKTNFNKTFNYQNQNDSNNYYMATGEPYECVSGTTIYNKVFNTNNADQKYQVTIYKEDIKVPMILNSVYKVYVDAVFESGATVHNEMNIQWAGAKETQAPTLFSSSFVTDTDSDDAYKLSLSFKGIPNNPNQYKLYVYRRNIDGSVTLIKDNISNISPALPNSNIVVVDPHPFIGLNTYIVGCVNLNTGSTSCVHYQTEFNSMFPIIDFDEKWLPYTLSGNTGQYKNRVVIDKIFNITLSENNTKDKADIQFAGRRKKTSYYGVSDSEEQQWQFVVPRNDKETLYKLRLLSLHKGSVYIREPNGRGYWANVEATINDNYNAVISNCSLKITVAGGIDEA